MAVLSAYERVCASPRMSGCRLPGTIHPRWVICSPLICLCPIIGTAEEEAGENGRNDVFPFLAMIFLVLRCGQCGFGLCR